MSDTINLSSTINNQNNNITTSQEKIWEISNNNNNKPLLFFWQNFFSPNNNNNIWNSCWGGTRRNESSHKNKKHNIISLSSSSSLTQQQQQCPDLMLSTTSNTISTEILITSSYDDDDYDDSYNEEEISQRRNTIFQTTPPLLESSSSSKRNNSIAVTRISTTTSHHHRDLSIVPPLNDIYDEETRRTSCIPLTIIDPTKCLRRVSALDDDYDDHIDRICNNHHQKRNINRRPSKAYETWIDSCLHGSETESTYTKSVVIDSPKAEKNKKIDSMTTKTIPAYLPIEPIPPSADSTAILTVGWAAVLLSNDFTNNHAAADDDDNNNDPVIDSNAIYYIQLHKNGNLHLIPLSSECYEVNVKLSSTSYNMDVMYVSARAGQCLTIRDSDGKNVTILPVRFPRTYIQSMLLSGRECNEIQFFDITSKKGIIIREDTNDLCCNNSMSYAPQAQHDATMYMRFAMDSALRCSS